MKDTNNNFPTAASISIFYENQGQIKNPEIRFYEPGGLIWFTDNGVWFRLKSDSVKETDSSFIIKQCFKNANEITPEGRSVSDYQTNFFYGDDPLNWKTRVHCYYEIYYENLYEMIDLRYYINDGSLKYDFIVHPGGDVSQIKIKYEGASAVRVDDEGNLVIETRFGNIFDKNLFMYQSTEFENKEVKGQFKVLYDTVVGFELVDGYSKEIDLIIDPEVKLEYSTYLGHSDYDYGMDVSVDSGGNAVVTGRTKSLNFPTTIGANDTSFNSKYDIFVSKFNAGGTKLLFSTFIGGSENDYGYGVDVDSAGGVYVAGSTDSTNFPVTAGAFDESKDSNSDIVVFKLSSDGAKLEYSTFLGGTSVDIGDAIAVDPSGNAVVLGHSQSSTFPVTKGSYDEKYNDYYDLVVFKLNKNGSKLNFSTFIGGNNWEYGTDIVLDKSNDIFLTGYTQSIDFPVTDDSYFMGGTYDAVVIKLSFNGTKLLYSVYLGSTGTDVANSIGLNPSGNAVVVGRTRSSTFPTSADAFDNSYNGGSWGDSFITQLNHNGTKVLYSTFLGDAGDDEASDVYVDPYGDIVVTGSTTSKLFPVTGDAYRSSFTDIRDGFLVKFSHNLSVLKYSTFIGGNNDDHSEAMSFDSGGNAYITGYTDSTDYFYTTGAFDSTHGGFEDVFLSKFSFKPTAAVSSVSLLKSEVETSVVYSRLQPYTFRVKVYDSVPGNDLEKLTLNIDPAGTDLQLQWTYTNNQFAEVYDPDDLVIIDGSSNSGFKYNIWTVDFNLTFAWDYPHNTNQKLKINAFSTTFGNLWFNTTDFFRVENRVDFIGNLTVEDGDGNLIKSGDLMRGRTDLKFYGLIPVYYGSVNVVPPEDDCYISLWNDLGNQDTIAFYPDGLFEFETQVPNKTYEFGFEYTINYTGIPAVCDVSNVKFSIRVDADPVIFSDPLPPADMWHRKNNINIGITITDIGGGVVNGSSVYYTASYNNGTTWDPWLDVLGLGSEKSIDVTALLNFKEGVNNIVIWKAEDSLGNGPAFSLSYRIKVDSEHVLFSSPWPAPDDISRTEKVKFGITISDQISGVNGSSVEYSVSADSGNTWDPWKSAGIFKNGLNLEAEIELTFPNGTENRLKWRAMDVARNGPVESSVYTINVNTYVPEEKLRTALAYPMNETVLSSNKTTLIWTFLEKNHTDVSFDIYFGDTYPPPLYMPGLTGNEIIIEDLEGYTIYYWKVIPRRGDKEGVCTNGIWNFEVPSFGPGPVYDIQINGPIKVTLLPGESTDFELLVENRGTVQFQAVLSFESGKISDYIDFPDDLLLNIEPGDFILRKGTIELPEDWNPGLYPVNFTVKVNKSGFEISDVHEIIFEVLEPEKEELPKQAEGEIKSTYILLAVIVIIIIIMLLIMLRVKRKKDYEIKDKALFVGKPGALQPGPILVDAGQPQTLSGQVTGTMGLTTVEQSAAMTQQVPIQTGPGTAEPKTGLAPSPAVEEGRPKLPPAPTSAEQKNDTIPEPVKSDIVETAEKKPEKELIDKIFSFKDDSGK